MGWSGPARRVDDVRRVVADLQAGAFPNSHENHWVTRAGALRLISWENTCLTDEQGAVTHVISAGIDITEARRGGRRLCAGIEAVGRLLAERGPDPAGPRCRSSASSSNGWATVSCRCYCGDRDGLRVGAQRGYQAVPERLDPAPASSGASTEPGGETMVADVWADPDYVCHAAGVVAEIAVPLLGDGETLGVLNIETEQPGGLTPADLRLARAVADRLATALLRNREQEALRDRMRLFASLTEFAGVANAILDPGRLATALVDAVGAVVPTDTIVITTLDRGDGQFRVRAVRGLTQDAVGEIIRPGDGNTGRAIVERAIVSCADTSRPRALLGRAARPRAVRRDVRGGGASSAKGRCWA